ncbi:sterol O-acyltransferase 1 isoform X3 [Struthio camelus]|uniref:sterol O-acyltransferase 1 isoform X3 n=1 Tax=Struthio camelus TaxID=8801 RepID=UPI003603BB6F
MCPGCGAKPFEMRSWKTMAGEDCVRKRQTGSTATYRTSENEETQRRSEGERSFQNSSNGRVDVDHVITRKMQLIAEAEQLKPAFMKEVDSHFTEFVNSLVAKSALLDSSSSLFPAPCSEKDLHKAKILRAPPEHGKIFTARRSLLDELFEVSHIRTIYHMFIALLIVFILSTLLVDFIDEGRLVLGFDLLVFVFGKFPVVFCTWLCMFSATVIVPYSLFSQWAQGYCSSSHRIIRSLFYGMLFTLFQTAGLGLGPTYVAVSYTLPPASQFIVILEQVRFIMKAHSFIRENVPRVLSAVKEKSSPVPVPRITQYLYFLFAPTLIYRDNYPRNPTIRWGYVATKFAQVLGSLFYAYYIFVRLCIPQFRNSSQETFNLRGLVLCIFNSILPDRMFYKDWWNSTSYANYYRTWNVVVHDWLYYYAYRDFLWFFGKKFKAAAMLLVFTVSAAVHEYVLIICFGYFYPVLFCLFMCFGMVFNFILNDRRKGPIWNVIMWTSLFLGQGVIICLYSQEWYARQYCPLENPTFLDYLKPRSWSCHVQM